MSDDEELEHAVDLTLLVLRSTLTAMKVQDVDAKLPSREWVREDLLKQAKARKAAK